MIVVIILIVIFTYIYRKVFINNIKTYLKYNIKRLKIIKSRYIHNKIIKDKDYPYGFSDGDFRALRERKSRFWNTFGCMITIVPMMIFIITILIIQSIK